MKHAYLVGKGPSLDEIQPGWFDADSPVWCLNQAASVMRALMPGRELHCVQNDPWIKYAPPSDVTWHRHHRVPAGGHPDTVEYDPELLTGHWASPTCMCALELLYRAGYDDITLFGFDSHFSGTRDYADCLGVKADCIAPFEVYDTAMRRWARYSNVTLKWMDDEGVEHADKPLTKCLVAVACGGKYVRQTERMAESFVRHNPGWDVAEFFDDGLSAVLPAECRKWSKFDRCEIGRWLAMEKALERWDTCLYCDGDIRWYAPYQESVRHDIVLYPHYVTDKAAQDAKHFILKDGRANLGMFEISRTVDRDRLFDYIVGEVMHSPNRFKHGDQLWLQNLISTLPECGFDAIYNMDPGYDCAAWALRHGDRIVFERDGVPWVKTNTQVKYPLRSFHFSSKSIGSLVAYGPTVQRLANDYLQEGKNEQ